MELLSIPTAEPPGIRSPASLSRAGTARRRALKSQTSTSRTRVVQYAVAEARHRNAHQVRSERLERSQQRDVDERRYMQRADLGRSHALQSNERAKEHRKLKHEYNQAVGRSIRVSEAEWDAEREKGVDRPLPAAFGSYSNWAGPKEVSDDGTHQIVGFGDGAEHAACSRAIGSAGRMQFAPSTKMEPAGHASSISGHQEGGGPGAYDLSRSDLAVESVATFNAKSQEQVAARAAKALPTGGSSSSGGGGGSSRSTTLAVPDEAPPWWLFKFNPIPLREEASSGELSLEAASQGAQLSSPLGGLLFLKQSAEPRHGANAGTDADVNDGAHEGAGDGAANAVGGANAGAGQPWSCGLSGSADAIPEGTIPTVGSFLGHRPLNARARKELRERREAAEREAQWKAKHHRGAHVPPPLPNRMRRKRAAGTRNYYAILKVAPSATADQIKHAYHKLAREWHPDRVNAAGASNADPDKARRMFVLIARAYEVLGDTATRNAYDAGEDVDAKAKFSAK
jgi:hypothetical protein